MNTHFKRSFLLTICLLFAYSSSFSQEKEPLTIPIALIKKGLRNIEYMRALLLENGFKLQSQKEEATHLSEYWHIPNPDNSFGSFAVFQINKSFSDNLSYCSFNYSVRKNLHPEYFAAMNSDVHSNFPQKRVQEIEVTTTDPSTQKSSKRKDYRLTYFTNDNPITVELDDDGNWAGFDYTLSIFKNPAVKPRQNKASFNK